MKQALIVENVNKYFIDENNQKFGHIFRLAKKEEMFQSVKDVSFEVDRNTIFGILGPNGCGKSTLIRMITTLIIPDSGTIKVLGHDVERDAIKVKQLIGRVSVDASFFMKLSAMENLDYAAGLYALDRGKAKYEAANMLRQLGFPMDKINTNVERLSRGQQQKIAIARGFLSKPKLLLLDEPTTGLDPVSKLEVQRFIKKVMKTFDTTIVITSHDMKEIDKLCQNIIIMADGRIIARGTSRRLKSENAENDLYEIKTDQLEKTPALLRSIPGIYDVHLVEDESGRNRLTMRIKDIDDAAGNILAKLKENLIGFQMLVKVTPTLEDVFVKLTGKTLK